MNLSSHLHWPFRSGGSGWGACVDAFHRHGLQLPVVPIGLSQAMQAGFREERSGRFSTTGWRGASQWTGRVEDWVSRPDPARAFVGLHRGVGERIAEVCLVTPRLGIFMRHRLGAGPDGPEGCLAAQSAYRSAGQLLARAHALMEAGTWVDGQRLMLVDDDLDLPRWGWLHGGAIGAGATAPTIRVMRASHVMYADVTAILDSLAEPEPDLLPLS